MPRVQPVEPEGAPEASCPLMEQGAQAVGQTLNFHREFANSPASFKAYLDFSGTMQGGALDRQMQEAIAVAVSDYNGCVY